MSLRDDLIAAKALIDTPEKFKAYGMSRSHALYDATKDWRSYFTADQALKANQVRGVGFYSVMEMFDRAIASAGEP